MKRLFLITFVFAFLLTVNTMAQINYYVDPAGTDIYDGSHGHSSGTNAWKTIEFAVNNVDNPTTAEILIHVSGNTYTLNNDVINISTRNFTNLTVKGAGAGTTIVQAASSKGTAAAIVFWIGASGGNVSIKDLTIRYGNDGGEGGGIRNESNLILSNCDIVDNYSGGYGGGIVNTNTLTAINCTISGNVSYYDSWGGGGILSYGTSLTLTNCTISGNNATQKGGGLYLSGGTNTLTNCTIANNTCGASYTGGGVHNTGTLYIKNTIIANNTISGGTANDFTNSGTVNDNDYNIAEICSGYTFSATHDITGEQASLNLSSTLEANNTTNGTYTLKTTSGSIAINAGSNSGTNNGVSIPTQDQRAAERNGATDIGAYEYWADDAPLPVELTSFSASGVRGKVVLIWSTETEVNNYGFEILRFAQKDKWEKIGFVQGHGNSNSTKDYIFTDNTPPNGKIKYRLKQIDFNGAFEYSNDTELDIALPANFSLHQNYPNPFNPETTISYTLQEASNVSLKVYDVLGREVAMLVNEFLPSGTYKATFNVETRHGASLQSGVYFYRLQAGSLAETKKLVLMK